jgi:hypothetical protein
VTDEVSSLPIIIHLVRQKLGKCECLQEDDIQHKKKTTCEGAGTEFAKILPHEDLK